MTTTVQVPRSGACQTCGCCRLEGTSTCAEMPLTWRAPWRLLCWTSSGATRYASLMDVLAERADALPTMQFRASMSRLHEFPAGPWTCIEERITGKTCHGVGECREAQLRRRNPTSTG